MVCITSVRPEKKKKNDDAVSLHVIILQNERQIQVSRSVTQIRPMVFESSSHHVLVTCQSGQCKARGRIFPGDAASGLKKMSMVSGENIVGRILEAFAIAYFSQ